MSNVKRRDLVKTPVAAQAQGSKGALDEEKVQGLIASVKPAVVMLEVEHDNGIVWGSGFFVVLAAYKATLATAKGALRLLDRIPECGAPLRPSNTAS